MADEKYIKKIALDGGNEYWIQDADAQAKIEAIEQEIAGGVHWRGFAATVLDDGATTNPITMKNGSSLTAAAGDMVCAPVDQSEVNPNTEFIFDGIAWQKLGQGIGTFKAFAYVDTGYGIFIPAGTNSTSSVSFGTHTTANVLGVDSTFAAADSAVTATGGTDGDFLTNISGTVPKVVGNTSNIKADISNIEVNTTASKAVTGIGDPTTTAVVTGFDSETSKLDISTITGVSGATTASYATAGAPVSVASVGTTAAVVSGLGIETTAKASNTVMYSASVENETLKFSYKPVTTSSIAPAVDGGTITPYSFTDVSVPVAGSATTYATGTLSTSAGGATIMTSIGTPTTVSAVTALGAVSTANFVSNAAIDDQPKVSLDVTATATTATVPVVTTVSESGTYDVNVSTTASKAITGLGTLTAAGQTITVTPDTQTPITALGEATAAAQTFTGTQTTVTVYPGTPSQS